MHFKPLAPSMLQLLLKDETDVLTSRAEARAEQIQHIPCRRCGNPLTQALDTERPFRTGETLPAVLASCQVCGYAVDMQSGLVVATGDPKAKQPPDPLHIFGKDED
jgi:hypothetical protein